MPHPSLELVELLSPFLVTPSKRYTSRTSIRWNLFTFRESLIMLGVSSGFFKEWVGGRNVFCVCMSYLLVIYGVTVGMRFCKSFFRIGN